MAFDNGYSFPAQNLPTPTDTPYDSPSMGISRQSSRQGSSSPSSNYSSIPLPPSEDSYFLKEQGITDDDNLDGASAHESRRLTPNNLGVSLVTQIHSLRKEMGSKNSMIDNLEESLHKSRAANQQLTEDLKTQKSEVTSVRNQMQALENDMLRALEDMAKERDNAVESSADTRKRLEDSKYKVRAKEEEANKTHALWEKDRQNWHDMKRRMEGRVHVVEERLKTMATEMLVAQNTDQQNSGLSHGMNEELKGTWVGEGNDTSSVRAVSHLSNRSLDGSCESKGTSDFRSSRMSGLHGLGGSQMSGLSLAQELELDEGEDVAEQEGDDQDAHFYRSVRRYSQNTEAEKVIDFHANSDEESPRDESSGQHSISIINDYIEFSGQQLITNYTDTGTQFSPPPSPSLQTQDMQTHSEQTERAANQSRKRTAIPQIMVEQTLALKGAEPKVLNMDSAGDQKLRRLEDPALTAKVASETHLFVDSTADEMKSVSTQTFEEQIPVTKSASFRLSPLPMDVPVIAIHPPASRPSSSRNSVMLPPRTRNAACQVVIELPKNMKSTSMQTEDTKIDKPLSDLSTQTLPRLAERREQSGNISAAVSSRRGLRSPPIRAVGTQPSATTARVKSVYAGVNDDGPLNHKQRSGPRRPIRSQSLFAGFDLSSDEDIENAQDHFSDDDFLNAAPLRKTLSKVQNSWKLVPQLKDSVLERLESASEEAEDEKHVSVPKAAIKAKASTQTTSKTFQTRPTEGHRIAPNNNKQPDMRRKALISNGIAEHAQRGSESNVLGNEVTVAPPFPVPTRSSSRIIPLSASDGGDDPSLQTTTFFSARHGQNYDTPLTKRKMLRKVQSAAAVIQPPVPLRPQPTHSLSASSTIPPSPRFPAPRRNQFILPHSVADLPNHCAPPQPRTGETSVEIPEGQTSVVDTIAQTMVGEWMWKYVRKRISFGLTENPQAEFESGRNGNNGNGHGVRHKRWVWLAPFERAVIWSSKQPTSGPALLGKGGRKLLIQSVLDVKDETPLPKSAESQPLFDRSILILTPQRALKFTATSRERHYVWLAALSYISNTTRGMDELASPPPLPTQEYHCLPSQEPMTGYCRTPLEDSIGTAKVKARPSIGMHSYSSPIGLVEQEMIDGARLPWGDEEAESHDAAEPPQVYRFATHVRKRSSTGPRAVPPNAFHNYATHALAVTSSCSLQGATWRERYDSYAPQPQAGPGSMTRPSTLTRGMTEGSVVPSPVVADNLYESGGTVRMEAFVKGKEKEYAVSTRSRSYRTRQGRKKDMSFWGMGFDTSVAGGGLGSARQTGEDPFTGF